MPNRPYLLLVLTTLSWAGNAIAGKLAAGSISPMLLTSLRWAMAVSIALPFAWRFLRADRHAIARHWPGLAALGATGFALFNVLLYSALAETTAMNVVLIQGGMPAVIFLVGFLAFRNTVLPLQIAGFLLTLIGVLLVVAGSAGTLGSVNRGDLLMLFGVVLYSVYTTALARKPDIHWLSAITVMGTAAFVASLPFAAFEITRGVANWPDDAGAWAIVGYTAVFPSLVAQVCYIRANELIGANRAGMFVNLVPVAGALMAVVVLGEAFRMTHAAALLLTLGGIALAEWAAQRTRSPHPRSLDPSASR